MLRVPVAGRDVQRKLDWHEVRAYALRDEDFGRQLFGKSYPSDRNPGLARVAGESSGQGRQTLIVRLPYLC